MNDHNSFVAKISCSEAVELVTDYLDEALSQDDLARYEAHLASCQGCTVFVDQIKMTISLTGAIGNVDLELLPGNFDELLELLTRDDR